ncbi:MAG: hypothetical protein K6A72_10760, partial [Lachnospiraceae bacterium]|nr:hypothetical protein [Lachnospiraceae bacterium]
VMKRLERTGFVEERLSWVDTSGRGTLIKAHVSNDTSFILKEEYKYFKQIVLKSNMNSVSSVRC